MEARLERGDKWQAGEPLAQHSHRFDIRRVVRGGDVGESLHRFEHVFINLVDAGQVAGVYRFEPDRRDVRGVLQHPELLVRELFETNLDGVSVVGDRLDEFDLASGRLDLDLGVLGADPFDRATGQHLLRPVAQVVEPVLEAGAAEVGDEDLHRLSPLRTR